MLRQNLEPEIDKWNFKIYENINNGVYKCGFAQSQAGATAFLESFRQPGVGAAGVGPGQGGFVQVTGCGGNQRGQPFGAVLRRGDDHF